MFKSFIGGGFECATHRRPDGLQLDIIAGSRHDAFAATDYRLLGTAGLRTLRDGLRWHLVDRGGQYDWSSFRPMLHAARDAGAQVIWDLCHYGLPHDLDIWSPRFVDRFAAFAAAAAWQVRKDTDAPPFWCAMNEISFWSWAGGEVGLVYPFVHGRGAELKQQLVRAALAATDAVRAVDGRARFVQAEPMIHIAAGREEDEAAAEAYTLSQFEAWDMLTGRADPALGGDPSVVDVIGVNFYCDNQWEQGGHTLPMGHPLYRPLHEMLIQAHARYARPVMLAETGAEGGNGPGWLRYVGGEVRTAMRRGVEMAGICIYPIMDYPGWDDGRHCPSGLIRLDAGYTGRSLDPEMLLAVREQAALFNPAATVDVAAE